MLTNVAVFRQPLLLYYLLPIYHMFLQVKHLTLKACRSLVYSFCLCNYRLLFDPHVPFLSLASVSAHYVPTVCNGREIVDSTTSSL